MLHKCVTREEKSDRLHLMFTHYTFTLTPQFTHIELKYVNVDLNFDMRLAVWFLGTPEFLCL